MGATLEGSKFPVSKNIEAEEVGCGVSYIERGKQKKKVPRVCTHVHMDVSMVGLSVY